ncbi:hypothetical protein [Sulfitobacter sp. PS-8MA]|uniref:hypothetical protein n=1 Tax=Sulfitobacter sp. PS-8MA TaxID=3237707 RepID=UPI0034C5E8A4
MSVETELQPKPRRPTTAWRAFVLTIVVLLGLMLALVFAAYHGVQISLRELEETHVEVSVEAPEPPVLDVPEGVIEGWARRASEAAVDAATVELRARLDDVFMPVHEAVPAYADFHYSVLGEYVELTEAAFRAVSSSMQDRLFSGFNPRLENALGDVGDVYERTFRDEIEEEVEAGRLTLGQEAIISEATRLAIDDTISRAGIGLPSEIMAAGVGAIGAKAAAAALGKVLVKGLAKVAAKTAAKPLGAGGAAAAGAAVGSIGGPPGAAVGGVVGAVVGWFSMDYAIVKIDELMNRDQFEADLHLMIDAEKELLALRIEDIISERASRTPTGTISEARRGDPMSNTPANAVE